MFFPTPHVGFCHSPDYLFDWLMDELVCYCEFNGTDEMVFQHAARYLGNQEWVKADSLKTVENTAVPYFSFTVSYIGVSLFCVFMVRCFTMYFFPCRFPLSCLRWMFHMIW